MFVLAIPKREVQFSRGNPAAPPPRTRHDVEMRRSPATPPATAITKRPTNKTNTGQPPQFPTQAAKTPTDRASRHARESSRPRCHAAPRSPMSSELLARSELLASSTCVVATPVVTGADQKYPSSGSVRSRLLRRNSTRRYQNTHTQGLGSREISLSRRSRHGHHYPVRPQRGSRRVATPPGTEAPGKRLAASDHEITGIDQEQRVLPMTDLPVLRRGTGWRLTSIREGVAIKPRPPLSLSCSCCGRRLLGTVSPLPPASSSVPQCHTVAYPP